MFIYYYVIEFIIIFNILAITTIGYYDQFLYVIWLVDACKKPNIVRNREK